MMLVTMTDGRRVTALELAGFVLGYWTTELGSGRLHDDGSGYDDEPGEGHNPAPG
jgi:hypothetical protein